MNVLVSACLLGADCKYNGKNNNNEQVKGLLEKYHLIPVCPEMFGGLMIPRLPAERRGDRVVNLYGKDLTEEFERGAQQVCKLAELYQCKYAVLKEQSPSCGAHRIYDGSFQGKVIDGVGFTAQKLREMGVTVLSEEEIHLLPEPEKSTAALAGETGIGSCPAAGGSGEEQTPKTLPQEAGQELTQDSTVNLTHKLVLKSESKPELKPEAKPVSELLSNKMEAADTENQTEIPEWLLNLEPADDAFAGKWYEKALFYHIYPLGFCGCPKENDGVTQGNHFDKLKEWIPHIRHIGCNAIYIGPLFESGTHGYDTYDYKRVDRRIGTNEDFADYVKRCHEAGIQVIVDGVFNHTGRGFFAFQDLIKNREASPYRDWYCNVNFGGNNEYNDGFCYDNWGGVNLLPKLNQWNPAVKEYIFDVIRFWVREFDIDGIRLDAADVLEFQFMKDMRRIANEVKPDFWLMGEVIHGDYSRWANGETLHSVTNYELHKGLYSGHNDHNYFEIAHSVKRLLGLCGDIRLYTFVDNHDVARIYSKLKDKRHLYPVYLLDYCLQGIPSVYYGSEFAVEGEKVPGSDETLRPCLELSDYVEQGTQGADNNYYKKEYRELIAWLARLGAIKHHYEELNNGVYEELVLTNRQFAFGRFLSDSAIIAAVNNDEKPANISIPVRLNKTEAIDLFTGKKILISNGKLDIVVDGDYGKLYLLK